MSDPFLDAIAQSDQLQQDARRQAFVDRAQSPIRPITPQTTTSPGIIRGDPATMTGNGNVEDRRPPKKPGLLRTAVDVVTSLANPSSVANLPQDRLRATTEVNQGVVAGIVRAPGVLVGSLMDFQNDTDRFIGEAAASGYVRATGNQKAASFALDQRNDAISQRNDLKRVIFGAGDDDTWSDLLSARETVGRIGDNRINQATAVIAASAIPSLFTGGTTGVTGAGVRMLASGAFGGGVVNDPYEERISNGLQALGVRNEFVDWLAQDDTDGAFESRFKGALEGVLAEGALEGAFKAFKAARYIFRGDRAGADAAWSESRQAFGLGDEATQTPNLTIKEGTPQQAARENLDKSFAQARTEEARAQQIQQELDADAQAAGGSDTGADGTAGKPATPKAPSDGPAQGTEASAGPEELPQGTRRGDLNPEGDGGELDLLGDAQEALRRAGSPEELTPENFRLSSDGRVIVSKESKALADEAGFGRSFAEDIGLKDDVIFATNGRVVGTMDRASVGQFVDDVAEWAARGVDDIPANDPIGQFKISNLGNVEDVQPVLRAIVDRIPEKRVVSVEEMMAASSRVADEVGTDVNAMLAYAQQFASNTDELYAAVGATRTMWSRLGANVDRHLTANLDEIGDDAFEAIAQDIRNSMVFGGSLKQAESSLGRGLYAARLPDADSYARAVRKGLSEDQLAPKDLGAEPLLPRTKEEVKDFLEAWQAFKGDPKGLQDWMGRKFKLPSRNLYLRGSVANFFTANLLSAPRTLALNIVGPSIIGAVRTLEKTAGGALGALNPGLSSAARRDLLAASSAAPTAYLQTWQDMGDALSFGLKAMKSGQPVLGGGGSIRDAVGQMGPITPALLKAANYQGNTAAYTMGNVINLWPQALQKVNAGMDEFAKRLSYMGEARAQFLVEGSGKGFRGRDLNEYVRTKLTETTDVLGHAESDELLKAAERSTFTGEVGTDGSFARGFSTGVSNLRKQYPEFRFILPIFNVPANALGETLRRVPGVNFLFKESNRELAGELGPVVQAEAYGRFVTGAALLGTGFGLSRMGLITGAGPNDPRDRGVWLQTHQPYSLRVGDQWVDYSRYDVIGAMLAIPATVFDRTVNQRQDKGWEHQMFAGIAALSEFMKDRAALSSLEQVLTFSSSPTSDPQGFFSRLGKTTLANLAVPNFVVALGRNPTDDVIRAKASLADYIFDKLPFASQTLDPMRNVMGEYVHKPQDSVLEGVLPITMAQAVSFKDDPELDEISRLNEVVGYAAGVRSPRADMGGFFDPREVKLEGGWSMWDEIMRNRSIVMVDGATLRQSLGDLFASDEYNEAVDADASNMNLSTGEVSRGALVAKVFEKYHKAARAQTAAESPIAARWLAIAKAKATDDGRLRTVQAREAYDNPDLLDSLGIDITQYEDKIIGDAQ